MKVECRKNHIEGMARVVSDTLDNNPIVLLTLIGLMGHLEHDHGLGKRECTVEAARTLSEAIRSTADRLEESFAKVLNRAGA